MSHALRRAASSRKPVIMNRLLISSLTFTSLALIAAAASLCGGCADDVAEPYQLNHPRVLAIRTEPAAIPAEGEARLEVLFTDGASPPRLAAPGELEVRLSPAVPAELASLLSREADGWRVRAPDEATLDLARAQLGLAAAAAVPLPLELDLQLSSESASLMAQKVVALGTFVGNPEPPQITIGDRPATAETAVPTGSEISLRASLAGERGGEEDGGPAGPLDDVTYRWFSSAGELRRYTQPLALLETSAAEAGALATVLVVARTPAGGVSWALAAVRPTRASEE